MRKLQKILLTFMFTFSVFMVFSIVNGAADFEIKNMDFNAVINSDGSMDVTETWNIRIDGTTNTLFKEYDLNNGQYDIKNVKVKDITNGKEFNQIHNLMHHVTTDCYYGMDNGKGKFEIAWGVNKESGKRSYQVTYRVINAITVYNDCAELYWQFVGIGSNGGIGNITGKIVLPANVNDIENLRVWAHGDLNGEIKRADTKTVTFKVDPYTEGSGLEVRLAILETEMFSLLQNKKNIDKFENILSEEGKWADEANRQRDELTAKRNQLKWAEVIISFTVRCFLYIQIIKTY